MFRVPISAILFIFPILINGPWSPAPEMFNRKYWSPCSRDLAPVNAESEFIHIVQVTALLVSEFKVESAGILALPAKEADVSIHFPTFPDVDIEPPKAVELFLLAVESNIPDSLMCHTPLKLESQTFSAP